MSLLRHARWLAGAALVLPAASAGAQGFGLNEVGTCAMNRGFAVTSAPCTDGSAIYWNPAATAELSGNTLGLGLASIDVKGGFRQDVSNVRYPSNISPSLVPDVFFSGRVGPFALGLGAYVPYGLTSQWDNTFPGRFSALKASLMNVYFQPNVAYKINDQWSIGAGPVIGHSQVELIQSLDLSQQAAAAGPSGPITFGQLGIASQTDFATARLKGTAVGLGFNAGIHGRIGAWQLGARYLSAIAFHYDDAKATFEQVSTGLILPQGNPVDPKGNPLPLDAVLAGQFSGNGALTSQVGTSAITDPWQAQVGLAYSGLAGTTVSADVARIGWSRFNQLPVTFKGNAKASSKVLLENYNDSWSYRFGAEHTVKGGALNGWTGRAGYAWAESPAPDVTVTPLLPDMNRRNYTFGVGIPFGPNYAVDAGYLHVNTGGRRGRIIERTSSAQTAQQLNSGVYDLRADVFSMTIRATF